MTQIDIRDVRRQPRLFDLGLLVRRACQTDDVIMMEQAISMAIVLNYRQTERSIIERGLKSAVQRGALRVLLYLLSRDVDVSIVSPSNIVGSTTIGRPKEEVLKLLLDHGWDINSFQNGFTLLKYIVGQHDLVMWCLDHGASVDLPGVIPDMNTTCSEPYLRHKEKPMLESLACSSGSVASFTLLREKDAPLSPMVLHHAVRQAVLLSPDDDHPVPTPRYRQNIELIQHLIDHVGMDVNLVRHTIGEDCSTPLCWAASRFGNKRHCGELVKLLLDRGADINRNCEHKQFRSPVACAEHWQNRSFLEAVELWQTIITAEVECPAEGTSKT